MFRTLTTFVGVLLLTAINLEATHIRGGHIQIKSIWGNSVTFEFVGLGDRGSSIGFGGGVFHYGDGSFVEQDFSITQRPISEDVTEFRFELTHTYSGPGRYTVSYEEAYRNADILNMNGSVNTPFQVETEFSLDPYIENSYPNISVSDVFLANVGERFQWAPAVTDNDGDLITFSLATPKLSRKESVINYRPLNAEEFYSNYNTGNSTSNGPPTFSIGTYSGILLWDAPGDAISAGVREYSHALRINEWRLTGVGWVVLSSTILDYQIIVGDFPKSNLELSLAMDLCQESSPYQLRIKNADSLTLRVNAPFFQTTGGTPFNDLDGLIIHGDTTINLEVIPSEVSGNVMGHVELVTKGGVTKTSRNVVYSDNCSLRTTVLKMEPPQLDSGIKLYPNPAKNDVKIEWKKNLSTLKVVTLTGKIVHEQKLQNHSITLPLGSLLQNGLYVIQFFDETGRFIGVKELAIVN